MCPVMNTSVLPCPCSGAVWKVLIKTIQPILPGPCAMWKVLHNTSPGPCPGPGSGPSQCEYTISRRIACCRQEQSPESVPVGSSHSQLMDIFPFHMNYTSQSHGTARSCKGGGFVNSAVNASWRPFSHVGLSILLDCYATSCNEDGKYIGRNELFPLCSLQWLVTNQ